MAASKKKSPIARKQKAAENIKGLLKPSAPFFSEETPEDVFQYLIGRIKLHDFFENYWEKKPLIIECAEPKANILNSFSKSKAIELLSEHDLHFYRDVHFCVCSDGKTKDLNKHGKVTKKEFVRLVDKMSATAQIHQVQRFVDSLWFVMERLESLFGSLVGSNVYITPQGCQGLAPHYDDVEVFIFQLEGEKHWRLYKPPVELAREYKTNLSSESIGDPTHDFVLKPGDVLYMPRGTVHQANTPVDCGSHSTHITISMYQRHSAGDFLREIFPTLIENGLRNCVDLRRGLPLGFFQMSKNLELKNLLIKPFQYFASNLKEVDITPPRLMIEDFMRNRLPPYGFNSELLKESPSESRPNLKSKVMLAYPKHVSFVLESSHDNIEDDDSDDTKEEEEEEEGNSEPSLIVYSSIGNLRVNHMISTEEANDEENGVEDCHFTKLKFPAHFESAMEQLLHARDFIEVQCLGSLVTEDCLRLVTSLWAEHLLKVI